MDSFIDQLSQNISELGSYSLVEHIAVVVAVEQSGSAGAAAVGSNMVVSSGHMDHIDDHEQE